MELRISVVFKRHCSAVNLLCFCSLHRCGPIKKLESIRSHLGSHTADCSHAAQTLSNFIEVNRIFVQYLCQIRHSGVLKKKKTKKTLQYQLGLNLEPVAFSPDPTDCPWVSEDGSNTDNNYFNRVFVLDG